MVLLLLQQNERVASELIPRNKISSIQLIWLGRFLEKNEDFEFLLKLLALQVASQQ
jgi:hypothetical protein